jgi:hypothetical protein
METVETFTNNLNRKFAQRDPMTAPISPLRAATDSDFAAAVFPAAPRRRPQSSETVFWRGLYDALAMSLLAHHCAATSLSSESDTLRTKRLLAFWVS